ncbi:MAG: hypothetical protein GY938_11575 [Ketobacter sp.]|nr:hypothetical protein [Ketobacter sp.]
MSSTGLNDFNDDRDTMLSLPIKKSELGNFVADLLGQPQSIERLIDEKFDVEFNWFVNLHELIDQRIHQQNHADLIGFTLIVYFDSGLKRTLTSVEAMKSYNETRSDIPIGVKIVWSYLVHFPAKPYPEKQQISFSAFRHKNKKDDREKMSAERLFLNVAGIKSERSSIRFQIDHTERTWGDDIEVIISNHIDEIVRKDGISNGLFEIARSLFALIVLLFGLIYSIVSNVNKNSDDVANLRSLYKDITESSAVGFELINNKLDVIEKVTEVAALRDENIGMMFLYIMLSSVTSVAILAFTKREIRSYIVLSKVSQDYRTKGLKREKRGIHVLIGSFALSVVASIVANYWYEFFK